MGPSAVADTAAQSNYLNPDGTQTLFVSLPIVATTDQSAYLDPDGTQTLSSTSSPTPTTTPTTYITTVSSATVIQVPVSHIGPSTSLESTTVVRVQTSISTGSSVVGTLTSTSAVSLSASAETLTYTSTSIGGDQTVLQILTTTSSFPATTSHATLLYTATSQGVDQTILQTIISVDSVSQSSSSDAQQYSEYTSYFAVVSTISSAIVPSQTSLPSNDPLDDNGKNATLRYHWSVEQTFLGTYFAVLVAVIYRILWTIVYNNFTLIEPFRQLSEPRGALAERSFFAFYQSQSNLFGPFPALIKRRWTLALVGTAYLVASFLPAIASETIFVDTNYNCPNPSSTSPANPCPPRMSVSITVLRIIQGLFAFAAVALLVILAMLLSTRTGLPANPSSMATVAALMRHPMLIGDLNAIPANATAGEMQQALSGRRYHLGLYKSASGGNAYGIKPMGAGNEEDAGGPEHRYAPVEGVGWTSDSGPPRAPPRQWHSKDVVLAVVVIGTFAVVLAYYLDGRNDGFNRFFSSNTFGPRFILTGASTVLASLWRSAEHSQIIMAPYTRLSRGPSSPRTTVLFNPSNTPILSTWQALRSRYFAAALLTIVAFSAEILNIMISGVPLASGQTFHQFLASAYLSMAVLGLMILTIALLIVRLRHCEPALPRKPDTLGSVMGYMGRSAMLDDFEGSEWDSATERSSRLQHFGKRYECRELMRLDGRRGWGVDEAAQQRGDSW